MKVLVNETSLTGIADAIRGKNGTQTTYKPSEMAAAIAALVIGGGGGGSTDIPEEAFAFEDNCDYLFASDKWKWFFDAYKDRLTFNYISYANNMFAQSHYETLENFVINLYRSNYGINQICYSMPDLAKADFRISGNIKSENMISLFERCYELRTVGNIFEECNMSYFDTDDYGQQNSWFRNCYSLREIHENFWDNVVISRQDSYGHLYDSLYYGCTSIDAVKVPVNSTKYITENCFLNTFTDCYRLGSIKFQTNTDGTPLVAKWTNQTIDLTKNTGYANSSYVSRLTDYNSGITKDDCIDSLGTSAKYAAMVNNPNWYTTEHFWANYNRKSAVETINSLPDTSTYVASHNTNTIVFNEQQGSATYLDNAAKEGNGKIGSLTAEEIAVATAKGWTVSLK